MKLKLFDSELKIMETLWKHGDCTAGQMAKMLKDEIGWNRTAIQPIRSLRNVLIREQWYVWSPTFCAGQP